jgi:hypothetical protein
MAELRFGGGINQLDDELVNDDECIEGENFLLDADSRQFRPRPSFDLKGTAPNGAEIQGIMQLIKRDDSTTTLIQAGTLVYSWDGTNSFTTVGTVSSSSLLRDSYWSLDDISIITDLSLATVVKQWNGTSFATMTHAISGVTNLYAKYSVVWQNRVWLFNIKTDSTDLPHVLLASEFNNYDNYNNSWTPTSTTLTSSAPFFLVIPDNRPINGVAAFFNTLLISTKGGRIFKLTGTDATNYRIDEFYSGSSAEGNELMVNMGNDVAYVRKGGHIERLMATDAQFGDTTADDLSKWIRDETEGISSGIAVYDQTRQRVCFFLDAKILVMDKYILDAVSDLSPWMKWTTRMTSNLEVAAAKYLRKPGTTDYSVYFGGPSGQIYDMNGTGAGDAGSTEITTYRKTHLISAFNTIDDNVSGRIHYRRKGVVNLDIEFEWSDEYSDTLCRVPLKGPITSSGADFFGGDIYWGEDNYWNEGGVSEERASSAGFSAVGKGPSFFLTTRVTSTVSFLVNKIEA